MVSILNIINIILLIILAIFLILNRGKENQNIVIILFIIGLILTILGIVI